MSSRGWPEALAAWLGHIHAWDVRLSGRIALGAQSPLWVRRAARLAARAGDGILWLTAGLVAYLGAPAVRGEILQVALGALAAGLAVGAVKYAVRRTRPPGAGYRSQAPWARYDAFSFPSGHAARVAALACGAAASVPPAWRLPLFAGAALICWGRVATAAHYLGDVLVGALLGSLAMLLVRLALGGALPM